MFMCTFPIFCHKIATNGNMYAVRICLKLDHSIVFIPSFWDDEDGELLVGSAGLVDNVQRVARGGGGRTEQVERNVLSDLVPGHRGNKTKSIKPINHHKLCSRWVPNGNEIDTNNIILYTGLCYLC